MAAFTQYAATNTFFLRHNHRSNTHPFAKKPFLVLSHFHTSPFLSKPTKRKNHLRQKLLKKPLNPTPHIEFPLIQEKETEKFESLSLDTNEQVQFIDDSNSSVGVLAKDPILKYGLWFFGVIVFQAVCAVWFFGDFDDSVNRGEKGRVIGVPGENGVVSGGYVNDLEMERKIREIRVMAREAREKERLESKRSGFDSDVEDEEMDVKSGIEEEVEGGLVKLKKKLEKIRGTGSVGNLRKGNLGGREGNEALLFRKKHKFKDLSGDTREKPRGFVNLNASNPKDTNNVKSNEFSNANGSLKGSGIDSAISVKIGGNETDVWWFNLPYVLAILMQRGYNGEGGGGLYTLKSVSSSDGEISHVVAFEDRTDATNFCYLLQSFFDELEDFNADIVTIKVKELKEEMKSRTMKAIVVKKGQLTLYAGQPLADAEKALLDMIRQ